MMTRLIATCILFLHAVSAQPADAPKQVEAKDPILRRELLQRHKGDQDIRNACMKWCKQHGISVPSDTDGLTSEQKAEIELLTTESKKLFQN